MISADHIVRLANLYADATGSTPGGVSARVFDDSKKVAAIVGGADITIGRYNRAMKWFSENWPQDVTWPDDIPRPGDQAAA